VNEGRARQEVGWTLSTPPFSPHVPVVLLPPLQSFRDYIVTLPTSDRPEAFGQHSNAEISYLIEDSKILLDSLMSLQPKAVAAGGGMKREDLVMTIATDLLEQVRRMTRRKWLSSSKLP
jgi:dynein heavy chain